MKSYLQVVQYLESLQIMPKSMPGLEKIKRALVQTDWYQHIDPRRVIVVAGTNGKGSTCAMLESLLLEAGQRVGFYSSPHLISTTERIRIGGHSVSETDFVKIFSDCENLIKKCELSHFEALTLMAGHFFFSEKWQSCLDYAIFEVGLGGTFDATNAFPHNYSVITALGLDHTAILGNTLSEVAKNKFGIIQKNNTVIYRALDQNLLILKNEFQASTNSKWVLVPDTKIRIAQTEIEPSYILNTEWGEVNLALLGLRAADNAMTALTVFVSLGYNPKNYLGALSKTNWPGRMQKISWAGLPAAVYLSGDHNPQGIQSLLSILNDFKWQKLHLIVGIGVDKDADEMLEGLLALPNARLYLTVTPFKGRKLNEYPEKYQSKAVIKNENPIEILNALKKQVHEGDLVLVTGSLYLVGDVLKASRI